MNSNSTEMLQCRNLTKYFGGLTAVHDASFKIYAGEIVGLIGANGAGKTTLFSLVSGFIKPNKGEITFKGADITLQPPAAICKAGLVRTYQICRPFPELSVFENVLIGVFNRERRVLQARQKAEEIINFFELKGLAKLPAAKLSTIARKRLELAKSFATGPEMMLLDEVLAGLNPGEVETAIEMIYRIHQEGITVWISEHNMSAIMRISQRIIVMNQGEIIAEGKPGEIASNELVIESYLGKRYLKR